MRHSLRAAEIMAFPAELLANWDSRQRRSVLWCCLRVEREGWGRFLEGSDDGDGDCMGEDSFDETKRGDCGGVMSRGNGERSRAIPEGGEKSCFVSMS